MPQSFWSYTISTFYICKSTPTNIWIWIWIQIQNLCASLSKIVTTKSECYITPRDTRAGTHVVLADTHVSFFLSACSIAGVQKWPRKPCDSFHSTHHHLASRAREQDSGPLTQPQWMQLSYSFLIKISIMQIIAL